MRRGGFEVVALPAALAHFKKHPHATAMIAPIAYEAVRIARLLGARARH
jgi:hypothetical protein